MIRKRGSWLLVLFLGESLTATAMGHFERKVAQAVVLAAFIPPIISSGGDTGSQARDVGDPRDALDKIRLSGWWRVVRREVAAGIVLGLMLAAVGAIRILVWQALWRTYGEHYLRIASTVSASIVCVAVFGTLAGSILPVALRRVGVDPSTASAPFAATLVDVCGRPR